MKYAGIITQSYYSLIPVIRMFELKKAKQPIMSSNPKLTENYYRALQKRAIEESNPGIVILESQPGGHPSSRDTYIAALPGKTMTASGSQITISGEGRSSKSRKNPWDALNEFRKSTDWSFGYLGYDLKNSIYDHLSSGNPQNIITPDLFMICPSVLIKISNGKAEFLKGEPFDPPAETVEHSCTVENLNPAESRNDFTRKVREIQEQIKEGDFYELNYTYPLTGNFSGDPFTLFRKMSRVNPVPFAAYIQFGDIAVCSASPERFLKKSGRMIMSEPIKGTSARSGSEKEDEELKNSLLNEKNRAENLMIVDLVRHDFSQVCKTGTVKVSGLYEIQSFDTVHQLISRVEGELNSGADSVAALKACFPMGSMTGAPKYRVMQEIEKYEIYKRGVYSGAIGYFTPGDDFDFNVVIRSAIIGNDRLIFPTGGAITSDSDPDGEWEETGVKARAITAISV